MPERQHRLPLGPQRTRAKRWYEKANGRARLEHEKALVAREYSTLVYQTDEETGNVYLEGVFAYDSNCGIRDEIITRVVFPTFYPEHEPRAYDIANRFPHTLERHFYEDSYRKSRSCLWLPPKSKWKAQDPAALLAFLDELVMFFERQLIFDATGKWPGPQYEHGYDGYEQWVKEVLGGDGQLLASLTPLLNLSLKISRNDQCPCGTRAKYKKCHLVSMERIHREIPLGILTQLFPRGGRGRPREQAWAPLNAPRL